MSDKDKIQAQINAENLGLAMLLGRLIAEVGRVRTRDSRELADWLSALGANAARDVEQMRMPGAPDEAVRSVKTAALRAISFSIDRSLAEGADTGRMSGDARN